MKQAIQEFLILLRKSGIRVSTSEALDCLNGFDFINLLDKSQFQSLLKSTLIKRSQDIGEFQRLFRLYFDKHQYSVKNEQVDQLGKKAKEILDQANGAFSQLFKKFIEQGSEGIVPFIFRTISLTDNPEARYPVMASYTSMRMNEKIEQDNWPAQISHLLSLLKQSGISKQDLDNFEELIDNRIAHLKGLIEDLIESERTNWRIMRSKSTDDDLMSKSFGSLNPSDIKAIRDAVYVLVKKIKDVYAVKIRRQKQLKIDIKKTIRKSQQYGGIPVEIFWRKRRKSKGKIVALCDVSDSVRNASRFMLTLLYSLQDQFSKVRSFVFVSGLGEVTEFFEKYDIEEAINKSLKDAAINYCSHTNYGNVLLQFHERYLDIVNSKTTVIFIGDGRNNYFSSRELLLEKIKSKAKRIIWLNPERKRTWGTGDSAMLSYSKYCGDVRECWNASQLMDFISELVL